MNTLVVAERAAGHAGPDALALYTRERSLMLRHNVGDMHDIVEGDVRFSEQFGMEI